MASKSESQRDGSESGKPACTRRKFLAGAAMAGGALAATPTATATANPSLSKQATNPSDEGSKFDQYGEISREGYRLLAEAEYRAKKNGQVPSFSKQVDAVKDLGLDPNGNEPVQNKIASAAESGMLVVCPKGSEFRLTGNLIVDVDGPFGLVGEGYKSSKHPPGPDDKDAVIFNADANGPIVLEFRTPSGLFANFAVDQRGAKQMAAMRYQTDGYQLVRDVRTIGPHSNAYSKDTGQAGPALAPETSEGATVRVNRYTNVGGGKSGTKNKGGMPIVWVGTGHHGTLQLIDCHVENSPDNGLYGGRTPGNTEIYRGLWRNNDVSQVRISGKGSRVDGAEIELDEKNYTGMGTKKGFPSSNGIKWDSKPTRPDPSGGKIVNCDIRGLTAVGDNYGVGALINVFPTAGAATVENTRIVNKIDAIPISADNPNGNDYPPPSKPWRIVVRNTLITGRVEGRAISIIERPNSLVADSCLQYQGASPDDIYGAKTTNVGYGKTCGPKQGLSAPKKVGGTPGSGLPPVHVSYSGPSAPKGGGLGKDIIAAVVSGILIILLIFFGGIAAFLAGVAGAMSTIAALLAND